MGFCNGLLNLGIKTIYGLLLIAGLASTAKLGNQNKEDISVETMISEDQDIIKNNSQIDSSQCVFKTFRQFWQRSGCKKVYFPSGFCSGRCFSISFPYEISSFMNVCRASEWKYQNITAACYDNGKILHVTKQIKTIHRCACERIETD